MEQRTDNRTEIEKSEEFYYQLAVDAWNAWKNMDIPAAILEKLSGMTYNEICKSKDEHIIAIRDCAFKAIAYFDSHAKDKNQLNEYADKRTVAHAGIRQNAWLSQILKYKQSKDNVTDSIKNLINFLENPERFFPILSESHKAKIYTFLTSTPYLPEDFCQQVFDRLAEKFECANNANLTSAITIYLYSIRDKWDNKAIKGLFMHDSTESWKQKFLSDMHDSGCGCLWWHVLPVQYSKEIMAQLSKIVDDGETFDVYYITNNRARYKATVIDFAVKENAENKLAEWKSDSPVWYNEDFNQYDDGDHNAAIVFLVKNFQEIQHYIPVENFMKYKDMTYNVRTGVAAYTKILTPNESKMKRRYNDDVRESVELLKEEKNLILQGAPGTGKTYSTAAVAVGLIEGAHTDLSDHKMVMERYNLLMQKGYIAFATFHQSMDYEDFVEGLRPEIVGGSVLYKVRSGIFKDICSSAREQTDKRFVLIIDEINRGNISKIFGELISLIEKDKRSGENSIHPLSARLTYSGEGFSVPSNLYIIGTMNTTDRSTGTLDYALRRRFVFKTMKADETIVEAQEDSSVAAVALSLFRSVNEFIEKYSSNDIPIEDLKIGHSFFLVETRQQLKRNMQFKVLPLIKEYLNDGILNQPNMAIDDIYADWIKTLNEEDNDGLVEEN